MICTVLDFYTSIVKGIYLVGCFFACREGLTPKHKAHVFLLIPIYLGSCPWIGREHWRKKVLFKSFKVYYLFLISFIYLFLDNFTIRVTHISQSRTPIFLAASVITPFTPTNLSLMFILVPSVVWPTGTHQDVTMTLGLATGAWRSPQRLYNLRHLLVLY